MNVMRKQQKGFILLTALVVLAGLTTLTSVMMTRSITELSAANRFVEEQQAFHLAEAGVDDTLTALSNNNALLSAIELLKQLNREPHRAMPEAPPLSFLPKAWRRLVAKEAALIAAFTKSRRSPFSAAGWLVATFGSKEPRTISNSTAIFWRKQT